MKTFPTWAITLLLLLQPAVVKSLAASLGVSSNASLSVHQANQKAKRPVQMEEPAHWITDYHCWGRTCVILLLLSEEQLNICPIQVLDRLKPQVGCDLYISKGGYLWEGFSLERKIAPSEQKSRLITLLKLKRDYEAYFFRGICCLVGRKAVCTV